MDKGKHILIVDDVTTNLRCAAEVLQEKYKLSMAKSGAQAIQFLQKAKPDLILLDIRMPEMDGYQTLEIIKANPETANIPVVFLTVDDQRESEIRGLKMGAMDFILKPFEPEVMLSRIDKILQIEDLRKDLSVSARKDGLTGLWNRKYLEDEVERYLQHDGAAGVFLIFDMDNFKEVNDTFGHIMGDAVLVKFSDVLQSQVGPRDTAARIGGDEFAVFLRGEYTIEEIREYCNIIMSYVERDVNAVKGEGHNVSVSVGIAMAPEDATDFMSLYNKADKALYYVKENGKGGFHFFKDREGMSSASKESKEGNTADMERLSRVIEERNVMEGAYRVEYDGFKHIYQFIARSVGRSGQMAQMALFTISNRADVAVEPEELENAMRELERSIIVSLRRGDVTTHYSSFQYIVLLMDTNTENANKVAKRIVDTWFEVNENPMLALSYDLREIASKKKPKK